MDDFKLVPSNIEFEFDIKGIEGITSDIFPPNFLCAIIGKPGSGKTSLLRKILLDTQLLSKKYDTIFLMSPSPDEYPFTFAAENVCNDFNLDWAKEKISKCKAKNALLIIDDFISYIKKAENDPRLKSLIFNRRHLLKNGTLSIIITSQRYIALPTNIRSNINMIICFKIPNKDFQTMYRELITIDKKTFEKMISCVKDTTFFMTNLDSNKYFLKFDQIIV